LNRQIDEEKTANPDLAAVEAQIVQQKALYDSAVDKCNRCRGTTNDLKKKINGLKETLQKHDAEASKVELTLVHQADLDERFAGTKRTITVESLDAVTLEVHKALSGEKEQEAQAISDLRNSIERRFADFVREWAAEAGGLDSTLLSASDFFA